MQAGSENPMMSEYPRFSLRALLVAFTIVALCVGSVSALVAFSHRREAIKQAESKRLADLDRATLIAVVEEVKAVQARIGRAPKDEAELETLMGRAMPVVHDHGYATSISYQRTGNNSFILIYTLLATDDWIYDSNKPDAGWVQHWN